MTTERLIRSSSVLDRANTIFDLVESQGEAGAFTGFLLDNLLCSRSQLARGHVAVRDIVAKARGKAYIRYEGAYLVTQDPDRCCGYIAAKVKSVHTELDRLLSCAISPFGDAVTQYAVLAYYRREIDHMLQNAKDMEQLGYPVRNLPVR
ncbi:hypothetical protein ACFWY5_28110 [Nonomuraea sp. NPDC059007]|uniref:hypothetical protein n=1 Tax=Nonomuraea sp. NPDC059007 TaxID=3346692 RepID=UPI00369CD241